MKAANRHHAEEVSLRRLEDRLGLPFQACEAEADQQLAADFTRLRRANLLRFMAYPDWWDRR